MRLHLDIATTDVIAMDKRTDKFNSVKVKSEGEEHEIERNEICNKLSI
jgi:hypothetical protein